MIITALILAAAAFCCSGEVWMARNTLKPGEIEALLKEHNDYRASVGASNMLQLRWDPKLAQLAEGHVQHCADYHINLDLPDGRRVGQNLAASSSSRYNVVSGVKAWISEKEYYNMMTLKCKGGWAPCGHLTQVIAAHTQLLGCAVNRNCGGEWKSLLICNYYPGNAVQNTFAHGPSCSACPGANCKNGLCACDNPDCGKHGSLDLETCSCKCNKMFSGAACDKKRCPAAPDCGKHGALNLKTCSCKCLNLFSGAACDKKTCPAKDKWMCGSPWPKSYCSKYSNVASVCPYMCGVC